MPEQPLRPTADDSTLIRRVFASSWPDKGVGTLHVIGERYVPNFDSVKTRYERWHRCLYATRFSEGKKVLDIACGHGHGSYLLSLNAQAVIGVDVSQEVIDHAARTHARDNLEFKVGSLGSIPVEGTGVFDLIVSFETIEGLNGDQQRAFLLEVKRLLKEDGLFIVSAPTTLPCADHPRHFSQGDGGHIAPLDLQSVLRRHFPHVRLLGQKIYPVSYIWIPGVEDGRMREYRLRCAESGLAATEQEKESVYALGLASGVPIDADASVLVDLDETILRRDAKRMPEPESGIQVNEAALLDKDARIEDLERTIAELECVLEERERSLEQKEDLIQQIVSGRGWKLLTKYHEFRERLLPRDTKRRRVARTIISTISSAGQILRRVRSNPRKLVQVRTLQHKIPLIFDDLTDYPDTVLLPENPGHLLVVDEQVSSPDQDAGSARMYALLKLLREMDFAITFVSTYESRSPNAERDLAQLGIPVLYGYASAAAHLARRGHQYGCVLLSRPDVALQFLPAVRAYALNSTVIYDTVDVHSVRFRRAAALSGDPALLREADRYQRMERLNAMCADLVLAVTQEDKASLLALAPDARVEVVPTIHTPVAPVDLGQDRSGLMFVGNFQHAPNVDAVKWFVSDVFPLIQRQLPGTVFHVIGGKAPEDVTTLASPSVRVHGYVPDLTPYFGSSRVFVAPLRYGAGMKGKIGQSMSYGLPVVTTTIGAEGIMLRDGETALIADSPEAFAKAVVTLYTDDSVWKTIAGNSLEHLQKHFSEEAIKPRLAAIFGRPRGSDRVEGPVTERAA